MLLIVWYRVWGFKKLFIKKRKQEPVNQNRNSYYHYYSCLALVEARQHCVAKICVFIPTANIHKLQNYPFTISSTVL